MTPNERTTKYLRRSIKYFVLISTLAHLLEPGETCICVPGLQGVCGEDCREEKAQEDAGERGKGK